MKLLGLPTTKHFFKVLFAKKSIHKTSSNKYMCFLLIGVWLEKTQQQILHPWLRLKLVFGWDHMDDLKLKFYPKLDA